MENLAIPIEVERGRELLNRSLNGGDHKTEMVNSAERRPRKRDWTHICVHWNLAVKSGYHYRISEFHSHEPSAVGMHANCDSVSLPTRSSGLRRLHCIS